MRRLTRTTAVAALILLTACGNSGHDSMTGMNHDTGASGASANKTLDIDMVDIAFAPKALDMAKGSTVRFVFHNKGATAHEAAIGDRAFQDAHEGEMGKAGNMENMHGADAVSVAPGQTGELNYTFSRPGTIIIGCHEPGHYAAGMRVQLTVA